MSPRALAEYFLHTNREATEIDAIRFAQIRFPSSPLAVAKFVAEWLNLRERLRDAQSGRGEITWEPVSLRGRTILTSRRIT
jgi:hypothetical protein